MKLTSRSRSNRNSQAFAALLAVCHGLRFTPHDETARQLDSRGHYGLQLDSEFPFHITLFHVSSRHYTPVANWHRRLEVVMALDGPSRMRMGEQTVELAPGDLLVVDNLKLHNMEDFPGFKTRLISVSFLPEFVYSVGSPACDYVFLVPFYAKGEGYHHVLRAGEDLAAPLYMAMAELLKWYFRSKEISHSRAGCKATFLQILYLLAQEFQTAEVLRSGYLRHRQQAERLTRILEHVREHYAAKISIDQAAQMVHMSQAQFMKVFKQVSGMTFVAHVTQVRIMNALRQLRETDLTIAEIAARCGFSDQSYFDRRFWQAFGKSPRQFRKSLSLKQQPVVPDNP